MEKSTWPYSLPKKALMKWVRENVTLQFFEDETVDAKFRFVGSTCGNMGHVLDFDFSVTLSPAGAGRKIVASSCQPAKADRGAGQMCAHHADGATFLAKVAAHNPGLGKSLEECLHWEPEMLPAGCLCSAQSRNHKWRNAFQTIHYALSLQEEVAHGAL